MKTSILCRHKCQVCLSIKILWYTETTKLTISYASVILLLSDILRVIQFRSPGVLPEEISDRDRCIFALEFFVHSTNAERK